MTQAAQGKTCVTENIQIPPGIPPVRAWGAILHFFTPRRPKDG
jgi:hypothetical protein